VLLALAGSCVAQGPKGEVQTSADFRSAVPNGTATADTLPLTFLDAIDRALKYNLGMISGDLDVRQTRAQRLQALADLLPNFSVRPSVIEEQTSLAAFGFTNFPGVPQILGPFTVVDARAVLSTPVVDLKSWRKYKAGAEDIKAAQFNFQDARDEVVLVSTALYLQALAGSARIESVRAQVAVSEALFHQASDRKDAGTVPGIDVLRAEVEWKQQEQRLISREGEFEKQKLALARAIGLPLAQKFSLADPMPYDPPPAGYTVDSIEEKAFSQRPDYLAKQAEVRASELRKQSAAAGRLPTVSFDANYGVIGSRIDEVHGTFGVAGSVNIPIYQGGRVQADVADADADLQHRKSELAALRARIDGEVRAALLDVFTAFRLVEVSKGNVELARKQLEQSRDRFADGVTNNVEVVQAQQALAAAEESHISSLLSFNAAKTQVARARGDAGNSVIEYLKGKR
jgi:outer membrane protein TolC